MNSLYNYIKLADLNYYCAIRVRHVKAEVKGTIYPNSVANAMVKARQFI